MLVWRVYVCCGLLFSIFAKGMEDNSLVGALFHYVDKNVDPKAYILDPETKKLSAQVLQFNLPNRPFNLDTQNLKTIGRVFERQVRLLDCIEPHFASRKSEEVESIFKTIDANIVSPNLNAIMQGFLTAILHKKIEELADLKKITRSDDIEADATNIREDKVAPADINAEQLKQNKDNAEGNQLNADLENLSSFEKFIEHRNIGYLQKTFNWARKKCFKDKYIMHPDSLTISEGVLRFDPSHTKHWELNPHMPTHINAIHMAVEREKTLLYELQYYINYKQHEPIMAIQKNTAKGYFSKTALAAMKAYLNFATKEKSNHLDSSEKIQQQTLSSSDINQNPFTFEIHETQIANLCKAAKEFHQNVTDVTYEATSGKDNLKKVTLQIVAKKSESDPNFINSLQKGLEVVASKCKVPADPEKDNGQEKIKNDDTKLNEVSQDIKAKNAASDHALNENSFLNINAKKVVQS